MHMYENFEHMTGVIQSIVRGEDCCTMTVTVMSDDQTVNFIVSGETKVIGDVRLRIGMRIAAFYDTTLPVPAIYPPQYQAEIVTALRRDQNVTLKYFDGNLVAEDNSLKLNPSPIMNIETANGQRFTCAPGNAEMLVYYTTTTFSIPPITNPQKIIVMCPY